MQTVPLPIDPALAPPTPPVAAKGKLSFRLLLAYCIVLLVGWALLIIRLIEMERSPAPAAPMAVKAPPPPLKPLIQSLAIPSEAVAALRAHSGPLPPDASDVLVRTCAAANQNQTREILAAVQAKDPTLAARLCLQLYSHPDRQMRMMAESMLDVQVLKSLSEQELLDTYRNMPNQEMQLRFLVSLRQNVHPVAERCELLEMERTGRIDKAELNVLAQRAASRGDADFVRQALRLGANPREPLTVAAGVGQVEVLRVALPHAGIQDAANALGVAASAGQHECVAALLAADVSPDSLDVERAPAIWLAAKGGHVKVLTLLIEAGARIEATDRFYGYRPLHVARNGATVRLLVSAGADLEAGKRSPLSAAAEDERIGAMETLLELGAKIEGSSEMETPLYTAIRKGSFASVKFLVEQGADVNRAPKYGHRPLREAMSQGRKDIVKYLEERGAKL